MTKIGFIGLGHMGKPMMLNLVKAGHAVHVYDVNPEAVQGAVTAGAKASASIAELVASADLVITSVQTGKQVADICLNPDGLFAHAKPGLLYIDCSSIDVITTKELHAAAALKQIAMLDSPVSGGVSGAEAATLTFMAGGDEQTFAKALPFLQVMGKKIVHAGKAGSGQAAKICNNLLLGISMIGVCEAFSLAKKLELDPKKFYEISSNSSGQCWSMTTYCPIPDILPAAPSSHNYEPGFMAKMMLKDMKLANHAALTANASIPLGAVATELYELFVDQGFGDKDFSGIIRFFEQEDTDETMPTQ